LRIMRRRRALRCSTLGLKPNGRRLSATHVLGYRLRTVLASLRADCGGGLVFLFAPRVMPDVWLVGNALSLATSAGAVTSVIFGLRQRALAAFRARRDRVRLVIFSRRAFAPPSLLNFFMWRSDNLIMMGLCVPTVRHRSGFLSSVRASAFDPRLEFRATFSGFSTATRSKQNATSAAWNASELQPRFVPRFPFDE
jgi:hypothetical protein